ncbi:CDP-alcohol phosphatidyltransferase family protein [Allonocardiopsis opalescens]|uniref:Phosphatidylglycerophosphate synthase n=1 Tax=Allonocardiopsis opalescens TaxID=1144618 RepID=A0A2T0QC14_9ACTN|nr:CDP-alcohol phosphatidyltransferase family protein [Allonocardiopsis opalescens]PRY01459.1 phosphatidylglycerophosphate synthase [Allonocardiopsis opalescens]
MTLALVIATTASGGAAPGAPSPAPPSEHVAARAAAAAPVSARPSAAPAALAARRAPAPAAEPTAALPLPAALAIGRGCVPVARPDAPPRAAAGLTLLGRLCGQLEALDVRDTFVIVRPEQAKRFRAYCHDLVESADLADDLRVVARLARTAAEPVVVLNGDLVAHADALDRLVRPGAGPEPRCAALTDRGPAVPGAPVRGEAGAITEAGSGYHRVDRPTGSFRGALRVSAEGLAALADAAEELAERLRRTPFGASRPGPQDALTPLRPGQARGARADDAVALLLAGLVGGAGRVAAVDVQGLPTARVTDAAAAREMVERLDACDDARIRLDRAAPPDGSPVAAYLLPWLARPLTRAAARRRLSPHQLSWISLWTAGLAAAWISVGDRTGLLVGAALLCAVAVLDCTDGRLARYTGRDDALMRWLEPLLDAAKEAVVLAGVALGAGGLAGPAAATAWSLAAAVLVVRGLAEMIAYSAHSARMADPGRARAPAPASWALAGGTPVVRAGRAVLAVLSLPRTERLLLIAATLAVWNPYVTLVTVLCWSLLATSAGLAVRLRRAG